MSNYLAIATVTAIFSYIIERAIKREPKLSGEARVILGRPKAPEPNLVGVNLYLYQVEPNADLRNQGLPTRNSTALNLNYLLTFYGKATSQEPERLMGSTIAEILKQPILTPEFIHQTIKHHEKSHKDSYLVRSDLAQQIELVRLTPIFLDLEELSKLWTIFFQVTHDLSIAYQAAAVLLDSPTIP